MTDKIYNGSEAEVFAFKNGQYHPLLSRVANRLPTHKENTLTTCALAPGLFILLTKRFDGTLEWLAVSGPNALAAGISFGATQFANHKGSPDTRKLELFEQPAPTN